MTIRQSLKKFLKSQDMFGHIVNLNFNQKGTEHTTLIGGSVSGLIKILISLYVIILCRRTVFYLDNNISSSPTVVDLIHPDKGTTYMNETNLLVFHRLSKQLEGKDIFLNRKDLKRHIDIYYNQVVNNYNDPDTSKWYTYTRVEAKQCTKEDFGSSE